MLCTRRCIARREFIERRTFRLRPACARQTPCAAFETRIQSDTQAVFTMACNPLFYFVRLTHGNAADHDACDTGIEQALHVILATHTAACLHCEALCGDDFLDQAQLLEGA